MFDELEWEVIFRFVDIDEILWPSLVEEEFENTKGGNQNP